MAERSKPTLVVPHDQRELDRADEPPVVARLVVEIRSDGSRTIARGAVEDAQRGERVVIEARGDSPIQLALALARSLTQLPRGLWAGSSAPRAISAPSDPVRSRVGTVVRGVRGLITRRRRR